MSDKPGSLAVLDAVQLTQTSVKTLGHYNAGAGSFWQGTRDHDVSQNIASLLRHLPESGAHHILDLGCGPGRDLLVFQGLGHTVVGLDGAEDFVRMAREHAGCEVWCQNFLHLQLPDQQFDGIFANASLFHVPSQELPRVIADLWRSLKPGGVLFSSNPHGDNQEGWSGDRYCCYLNLATCRLILTAARFVELEHYYRPTGQPRERQPWLASVWRKPVNE